MPDLITVSGVKEYLEGTRFECSDALPLSGGTANFIYRISLLRPVEGHSSLILKHGRPFVGNIPFSLQRQAYEVEALKWISTWIAPDSPVKVPAVVHFDEDKAVIIMEDVGLDAKTLKQLLLDGAVSQATAKNVGNALGEFIANVHRRSGGEVELLRGFDANEHGKSISSWATYGRLASTLEGEDMPVLSDPPLNVSKETMNTIAMLSKERSSQINASADCLVMGDFWPGNIVLSPTAESIYVIDWELAKTGLEGLDLGQFCAEIHTLRRFHPSQSTSAEAIISAFLQTYRRLRDHLDPLVLAGTVVTHVGAHLVAWTPRVEWGGREDTRAVVAEGVELLVGGYSGSYHQTQSWHDFLKASLAGPLID
ncbi:Carboxy-terminal domain (CTD) phosphatase [Pleurotus ostreatus]|uniref:Carboxy-terminal domain (CTD) phosphatase n=1 Tax=Pleurotus ostreatus TaxID=5322 RepID=A0A8H7A121_PLEOS|nr:Carboxy-terminal domain (CTD) phosphatase [Pleurotus ostreatus]KAF7436409.1 Carboxy-terminal domain (CTD) phosphatase [Pleurotus ostreatus]